MSDLTVKSVIKWLKKEQKEELKELLFDKVARLYYIEYCDSKLVVKILRKYRYKTREDLGKKIINDSSNYNLRDPDDRQVRIFSDDGYYFIIYLYDQFDDYDIDDNMKSLNNIFNLVGYEKILDYIDTYSGENIYGDCMDYGTIALVLQDEDLSFGAYTPS